MAAPVRLTASHCISKNGSAQDASLYWRFATTSCNGSPSNSGWPYVTTGATVSATGRKADFTLLRLAAAPPTGSVFLGWTSAPVANTNGADHEWAEIKAGLGEEAAAG